MFDPSGHPYFPGSNLILKGALDDYGSGNPINFASWMQYATIPMIINFFLCWLWLQMFYLGLPKKCSISRKSCNTKVNVFLVGPLKMTKKTPILNVICVTFSRTSLKFLFVLVVVTNVLPRSTQKMQH